MLAADKTLDQSITLVTASVQLSAQVVTASKERGTVREALAANPLVADAATAERLVAELSPLW